MICTNVCAVGDKKVFYVSIASPVNYREGMCIEGRVTTALQQPIDIAVVDARHGRIYSPDVIKMFMSAITLLALRAARGELRLVLLVNPANVFGAELCKANHDQWTPVSGVRAETITMVAESLDKTDMTTLFGEGGTGVVDWFTARCRTLDQWLGERNRPSPQTQARTA